MVSQYFDGINLKINSKKINYNFVGRIPKSLNVDHNICLGDVLLEEVESANFVSITVDSLTIFQIIHNM